MQVSTLQKRFLLVLNTGSTTTKCSIYRITSAGELDHYNSKTIEHPDDLYARYSTISGQIDYREELTREYFQNNLPAGAVVAAVGALGGMLPPVPSGLISVNQELADFSLNTPVYHHASNLGAPIAFRIAALMNAPAFVADPVGVDEITPVSRISGVPELPRFSYVHALNIRATVRKLAEQLSMSFEEIRCVACHLGGGFSIAPVAGGKIIDSDNRMEGAPFTPERAGGVPPIPLFEACFSGKYTKDELHKKLYGGGGLYGYLGTKDVREAGRRAAEGDGFAAFILDAMIYQICKEIGAMASVLDFNIHGIIVTGGVANSPFVVERIKKKCSALSEVHVFPGGNENEAIASGLLRVVSGKEEPLQWPDCIRTGGEMDPLLSFRDENGEFHSVPFGVRSM
ncbi:butyrate kinase [Candidatus Fermentibacteria bacterium]|nr:MAG: butyrate kinase [Candidatus Fermentibacteria bacterium]PIE53265.1 MAG: butyrate kinase [Candidatus Fermentibacteria bacterium]PIE53486.1 MAG: butyrate kinase [Candidatus Fermentibacteria bacterium]